MKIPNPLYPGAAVALVAPGSAAAETQLQKAMDLVRSLDSEAPDYREDLHQTITGNASHFLRTERNLDMKKPLIGITNGMGQAIYSMNMEHPPINQHRLNDSYVQAVIRAGGIPVIFPSCEDPSVMRAMVEGVDGVILSGGGDLDPAIFGRRATGKLGGVSPRRDAAELAVADYVLNKTEKPLLGICRGIQVLNVALGGSLHIDLPDAGKLDHALNMYPRNMTSHEVAVEENTMLAQILGSGGVHRVNSFHHQAVDELGNGLTVTARSLPDGVIEAVEIPGSRFVVGVQWHPEELTASEDAAALFRAFVAAAAV